MSVQPDELTALLAKETAHEEESILHETHRTSKRFKVDNAGFIVEQQENQSQQPDEAEGNPRSDDELRGDDTGVRQWHCSRLKYYLIEPMVLILVFAWNLSATIIKNQIIYQTCTAIFLYNESDCKLLGTKNETDHIKQLETNVQPYAARIFMTTSLIQSLIPAFFGVYIGGWSDRFGRKPLLVIAFAGYAIYFTLATTIAYAAMEDLVSPWLYTIAILPHALLGGDVTYYVAVLCFISDVSSATDRPYRMAFYEAAIYIGLMIGAFSSGYIYEATNSATVFAISAGLIVFAMFLVMLFLPESLNEYNRPDQAASMRDMWSSCFKPREFSDRAIILLTMGALLIAVFAIDGSITVFYLFIRKKFQWTVKQYTTYETFSIFVPIVGNLLGIWILRKVLRISVVNLAILAYLSQSASFFMKGFAMENWQLYLAIVLGALKSLGNPMCRTIITNIASPNELGKIFSFLSVLQSLVPFAAAPVYTVIYSITLTSFPGFFNLLTANLFVLGIAVLLPILRKKYSNPERYDVILS